MIISDKYEFAFIHIPKCAGSSVRNKLRYIDSQASFYGAVKEHPSLGKIDYGHIPLIYLQSYFPNEYQKLGSYNTFCVIRDPYERFPSSMAQYLRMYKNLQLSALSKKQFKGEVENLIRSLERHANMVCLPYDLIHFQRQVSYILNGDRQVVRNIYTIENIEDLLVDLMKNAGLAIPSDDFQNFKKKINPTKVFKNNTLGYVFNIIKPFSTKILKNSPWTFKGKISKHLYIKPQEKFNDILNSEYVKDFISEFYHDDIQFYKSKIELQQLHNDIQGAEI